MFALEGVIIADDDGRFDAVGIGACGQLSEVG
jgi:hypothetical protein